MGCADWPGIEGEPADSADARSTSARTAGGSLSSAGNHVELIPMQPDEEELAYRRLLMQPNFRLYREAYDAATKANDAFAARFYLNLFPPPERASSGPSRSSRPCSPACTPRRRACRPPGPTGG